MQVQRAGKINRDLAGTDLLRQVSPREHGHWRKEGLTQPDVSRGLLRTVATEAAPCRGDRRQQHAQPDEAEDGVGEDAGDGGGPICAVPAKLGLSKLDVGMHSRKTLDLGSYQVNGRDVLDRLPGVSTHPFEGCSRNRAWDRDLPTLAAPDRAARDSRNSRCAQFSAGRGGSEARPLLLLV